MVIEIADEKDKKELFELQKISFESESEVTGLENIPAMLESFDDFSADFVNWNVFVIRDENKRIIATARISDKGDFVEVARLMVHPNCRGSKIASFLMNKLEHENYNRNIQVYISSKSITNIGMFKHWGYEVFEEKTVGDNFSVVSMRKNTGYHKLIARGNTAEIFEHGEGKILKLFDAQYPEMAIEHEFYNAKTVYELGIKTPKAQEITTKNGCKGIVYERLEGDTLLFKISELMKDHEQEEKSVKKIREYFEKFVLFQKDFTSKTVEEHSKLMNYKDFLRIFSRDTAELNEKIDALPEGNHVLHGDYHPDNLMVGLDGEFYLIDMMNVCKGPAEYDIARTYFLFGDDEKIKVEYLRLMGMTFEDIKPYFEIISLLRNRELGKE